MGKNARTGVMSSVLLNIRDVLKISMEQDEDIIYDLKDIPSFDQFIGKDEEQKNDKNNLMKWTKIVKEKKKNAKNEQIRKTLSKQINNIEKRSTKEKYKVKDLEHTDHDIEKNKEL